MEEYYVYVYLDPRYKGNFKYGNLKFEFKPFYIGKGKNKRCYRAIEPNEFRKENKTIKRNYLEKLYSLRIKPIIIKLYENLSEEQSFNKEIELIKLIGRLKYKEGPLVNISNGGDGTSGWKHNKEAKEKIRLKKLNVPLSEAHKEALSKSGKEALIKKGGRFTDEHINKLKIANSRLRGKQSIKYKEARCKEWLIISPNNEEYKIKLLQEFCNTHKLSIKQMRRVAYGKIENYNGWICKYGK